MTPSATHPSLLFCFASLLLFATPALSQNGAFVIPSIRPASHPAGGTDFAYWDLFGPSGSSNYNTANPPAQFTGFDLDNNPSTVPPQRTTLLQTGTSTAFITSSAAIYSFAAPMAFQVDYTAPPSTAGEITNVIFQVQSGGTSPALASFLLEYDLTTPQGGFQTLQVAPVFRALDDPQTGAFSERLITALQWNLTGLGVRTFRIVFSSPSSSLALWQAQLDVAIGTPFTRELGFLLFSQARPLVRFGRPGSLDKNLPPGTESRFFSAGQNLTLRSLGALDWEPVGFVYDGVVINSPELPLTFPARDVEVTTLHAPLTYQSWRERLFFHANSLTGTNNDYTDPNVSGPAVDPDADGLNNDAEYAFGGDPYTPDPQRPILQYLTVTDNGVVYPALRYRSNGCPPEFSDLEWIVQVSSNLTTWNDNRSAAPTLVTQDVDRERQDDGTEIVTTRSTIPLSLSAPRTFFRVHVRDYAP